MASPTVRQDTARIIRAMDEECVRNVNSGNAEGFVAAFYAEDAEVFPPNHPPVSGRAAIREFWKGMISTGVRLSVLDTKKIEESGELAYGSGAYELTLPAPGGGTVTDTGKYIVVYRRQADGSWRAIADIFNSNTPVGQGG